MMTPDQFQTAAEAWIGAGVAVLIAITTAAAYVLPKLAALKVQIDTLKGRADSHDQQINNIAIATAPPPPIPDDHPILQNPPSQNPKS